MVYMTRIFIILLACLVLMDCSIQRFDRNNVGRVTPGEPSNIITKLTGYWAESLESCEDNWMKISFSSNGEFLYYESLKPIVLGDRTLKTKATYKIQSYHDYYIDGLDALQECNVSDLHCNSDNSSFPSINWRIVSNDKMIPSIKYDARIFLSYDRCPSP